MPFSSTANHSEAEWLEVFENLFHPTFKECGYSCERSMPRTGSLISSIIERLHNSQIVLADLTDHNPNVFYELGVRHSLSKRTIIVSQDASQIPSDLRGYWALTYSRTLAGAFQFKKDIKRIITELETEPERTDSPVADYLEKENLSANRHAHRESIKKLGALITEISGNILILGEIRSKPDEPIVRQLLTIQCLELLLSTLYVDIGADLLKNAYELSVNLRRIALGDNKDGLNENSLKLLKTLYKELKSIRSKMLSHEYDEPATPSTMKWVLPKEGPHNSDKPQDIGNPWICSTYYADIAQRQFSLRLEELEDMEKQQAKILKTIKDGEFGRIVSKQPPWHYRL